MILCYGLQVAIVFDDNILGDIVKVSSLCIRKDSIPVSLDVSLDWLLSKLEGSFQSGLFLHAVVVCTVVDSHYLEVRLRAVFLQSSQSNWLFEVEKVLNVRSTLLTFLKLPYYVGSFSFGKPKLQILLSIHRWVIVCTQPVTLRHFSNYSVTCHAALYNTKSAA